MTEEVLSEDSTKEEVLKVTIELFNEAAVILGRTLRSLKNGELEASKNLLVNFREVKEAFKMVLDERNRVDKLGTSEGRRANGAGALELDLDAARHEICGRLARLRDAGDG